MVIVTVKILRRNITNQKLMKMVIIPVEVVKTNPLAQLDKTGMRDPSSVSTNRNVKMTEKYGMQKTGTVIGLLGQMLLLLILHYQNVKLKVSTIFTTLV